ncbi:MAG: DUF262 domain-containing protein [Gammaproteobacteria bacterium]|nr:DUF262 domain-containing protein [Gammaproteobacteria bacterium]
MQAQHIEFLQLLNGDVQYIVPRWQRRYCWQQSDIERLVEDLLAIADAAAHFTHYAGALLTFPEPGGAAGVISIIRVVDGQQRLTTVSILLACIAAKLERDGPCGEWTADIIRERRLTNPHMGEQKRLKLRLQSGDEDEYRRGLEGNPEGVGAVTQAWRIVRRLVDLSDTARLLRGLERLRVVSIGLDSTDDPQQIFESLNATGRPLAESEKVKNWLLIGLPEGKQRELHDQYWRQVERVLGAEHTTEPIDIFLRDVMRWRTGEVQGGNKTYEQLRRWALKRGYAEDRPGLCRDLASLASLYGCLTGAAGTYPNPQVEAEIRHLREMGLDVHRPLTLRLLDEASGNGQTQVSDEALSKAVAGIGTWITRLWLADRSTAGMNKAVAELAHGVGPDAGDDYGEHWLDRIRRLRNQRIGVPRDEDVREGVRARKAYGSSATRSAFAVLCELMEAEHPGEAPARDRLTVEHVMPQKLTEPWKRYLGESAEEVHRQHGDRLANLTLSGDVTNASMGTNAFTHKREIYRKSSVGMTRRIADEDVWNEEALSRRARDIARRALDRWPWPDPGDSGEESRNRVKAFRWRIEDDPWRTEDVGSQMVLNVAAALLSRNPENADTLRGEAISTNVHPASRYPPGTRVGSIALFAVPGSDEWVLNPYERDYPAYAERCRKLGERCGVTIQVELASDGADVTERFWRFFKDIAGGVPGQKESWRGGNQWTEPCNAFGDRIGVYVGNPDLLWLYVRAGRDKSVDNAARMRRFSRMIRDEMADQRLADNRGSGVRVEHPWTRDSEDEWGEACQWIHDQCARLRLILATPHN